LSSAGAAPEPLDADLPRDLETPEAHGGSAGAKVEVIQTHISWVFLTADRVVKVRKAVRLSFVDFGTRALRSADCLREVQLNRRLAPDVYLGVAPLVRGASGWRVGPVGEELAPGEGEMPPEHAVVMRRLPAGRDALSLLERGELGPAHLDAVARTLAEFHGKVGLGRPAPFGADAWRGLLAAPMAANLASLRETPGGEGEAAIGRVEARFAARLADCASRLEGRRREGRAVDGHGDVHLQHIWFEAGPERPLLVDCIEFSESLRRIDAAGEVAFLAMDLEYRGRRDLAARFLRRYAETADDFGHFGVVDLYAAYRAAVRAKVAGLAARDAAIPAAQRRAAAESALRHLALAERLLAPPRPGPVVALCGTVGSGKTTAAERLADLLGGATVSSDRTRKHLAGLAPEARAGGPVGAGIYTTGWTDRTYAGLLERAEPVVASGRAALLDATFAEAARRRAVLAFAAGLGAPAWLVEVRCAEATSLARLARRAREGRDASDAGPELLAASVARFEAPAEWPRERHLVVESDAPDFEARLAAAAAAMAASAGG
jgi:aminoglycoside phosphotransferase family enzyme/predicted kinase